MKKHHRFLLEIFGFAAYGNLFPIIFGFGQSKHLAFFALTMTFCVGQWVYQILKDNEEA